VPDTTSAELNRKITAGFWQRFLAATIDGLVIGVPTFLLGLVFFAQFARLGGWGRAVGFVIALAYYGFLNSKVGNGQTLGKRLVRIRVVNAQLAPISISRSFLRFFILGAPIFLSGAAFPPQIFRSWIGDVAIGVIFGVGGSTLYLLVFNRRNRRSLHDLFASTLVVRTEQTAQPASVGIWAGHYVVIGIILIAFFAGPIFLPQLAERTPYKGVLAVQSALLSQEEIWYAAVFSGKGVFWGPAGKTITTTTAVTVWTDRPVRDCDKFANKMAGLIFDIYPGALTTDRVSVQVVYGYDLGIASGRIARIFNYSPAEWQQRLHAR
jgi:uncharacterized RDD family membrane protein YckC